MFKLKMPQKRIYVAFLVLVLAIVYGISWYYINKRYKKISDKIDYQKAFLELASPGLQFHPQPLSLEQIFSDDHSWTATLSAENVRLLITTGDLVPARSVNYWAVTKNNFHWPFEKTADFLKEAEIQYGDDFNVNKTRLKKEYYIYNEFGFDNKDVNFLYIEAKSNKEKAEYLFELFDDLGEREYRALLKRYHAKFEGTTINNVITDDLLEKQEELTGVKIKK